MIRALLLLILLPAIVAAQPSPDLFLVVGESGGRVLAFDGESEPTHRFALRHPPHGEPKFSPDGRHAFFASRSGWITRLDLRDFTSTEIRAANDIGNIAVSSDGNYLAVAASDPPALLILDADLRLQRALPCPSGAPAVYDAGSRRSFVVSFEDVPELWEVSYDRAAAPIAQGLVHDFRLKEGSFVEGFLNPRRTKLERPLGGLFLARGGSQAIGASVGAGSPQGSPVSWGPDSVLVASSGDLGVTFGMIRSNKPGSDGNYPPALPFFTVWRRASVNDAWRYIAE